MLSDWDAPRDDGPARRVLLNHGHTVDFSARFRRLTSPRPAFPSSDVSIPTPLSTAKHCHNGHYGDTSLSPR